MRHHALADVDVVRVQVVADIAINARPRLERLELALRLAHVTVEIVEVPEVLGFVPRVRVGRVVAFVVLDVDEDIVFFGGGEEREVVREGFDGGLGD